MKVTKLLFILFISVFSKLNAQNYIINPNTDGGFEGNHGWTIVNAAAAENKWYIGAAEKSKGSSGAYVSNNTESQSITSPQNSSAVIYLYKDVIIPKNANAISLSFKIKNPTNTTRPPRVFFNKTSDFPSTLSSRALYNDYPTLQTVLANEADWKEYSNQSPLTQDRVITFKSNTLEPGESYRITFEWAALNQRSYTQTSPVTIYPKNARIVSDSPTYTPGTTNTHTIQFDEDGQNYNIEWSIEGGSVIDSGQGTLTMTSFAPLGTTGIQTTRAQFSAPTPTFQFNGTNSGLLAIDEVSLSYVAVPKIISLSSVNANAGDALTISGEYFGATIGENKVFLAGLQCQITAATENSITVKIPKHANTGYFTVTNLTTKLTAVSNAKFLVVNTDLANAVYKSADYLNNSFEPAVSFATSFSSSFDQKFMLVDVDLDGKLDVLSYASDGSPKFLRSAALSGQINTSTFDAVTTFSNVTPSYSVNSSRSVLFSDFNNDGKQDFAVSNNVNNGGFVNPNSSTSTANLASSQSLLTSAGAYKVNGAFLPIDINKDGKIDVFGLSATAGTVKAFYSNNQSTNNNFEFSTDISNESFDFTTAYGGDYGDLNANGIQDVVYGTDGFVVLLENKTKEGSPFTGNFNFKRKTIFAIDFSGAKAYTVKLFDIDSDGFLDIVATNSGKNNVHIWRNTGSGFNFQQKIDVKVDNLMNTVGLSIGDLNGDGKPDLVVSEYINGGSSKIAFLKNTTTDSNISFDKSVVLYNSSDAYQQIELTDVDGDNKLDIVAANVSKNQLDILRNRVSESGSITSDATICIDTNAPEITSVTEGIVNSGDVVYSWEKSTTSDTAGFSLIANETNANLSPGILSETTYFRRGVASSNEPEKVYYTLPVAITVQPLPTLTKAEDVTICGSGSVPLIAETSAGKNSFVNWYDAPTGGNLLSQTKSGETFNTPTISESTTFYAEAENENGCKATSREPVEAILNLSIPTLTLGTFDDTKCDASSFTLTASTSDEAVVKWFNAPTDGTLLRTGNSFTTPILSANTTYYVEASNCNGASSRVAVDLTIINTPTIISAPNLTTCQYTDVVLTAQASAGDLNWYQNATGGVANDAYATITNINTSLVRYVSASITVNGVTCESPRTPVSITMEAGPRITNASSNVTVYGDKNSSLNDLNASIWISEPTGTTTNWYADQEATQLLQAANRTYAAPIKKETTTYYAVAIDAATGCKSAPRAVTVSYRGPLFEAISNTFALTNQENVAIKATGISRFSRYDWQRSDDGGVTWRTIDSSSFDSGITYSGFTGTSGTDATLLISKADSKLHGFMYRLQLTGTSFNHKVLTNSSLLTIADIFGACDTGNLPVLDYTYSSEKAGLTTLSGAPFTSDKTKLADNNTTTGLVVTNSESFQVTSSLRFDGNDDNVFIGRPNSIQNITTGITVEAWVKPNGWYEDDIEYLADGTDLTYRSPVVEKDRHFGLRVGSIVKDSTYYSYGYPNSFKYTKGGVIAFIVHNGTKNETVKTETKAIPQDEWSHIAATYDSSSRSLRIYVNGVLTATKYNSQFSELGTGGDLVLGGNNINSDRHYDGFLDEVRIWNYPKSETEIRSDMAADVSGNPGLSAYYKFMEGDGTRLADLSGNDANGILNNFNSTSISKWSTDSEITDTKKLTSIIADLGSAVAVNGVRLSNFNGLLDGGTPVQPNFTGGYLESSTDGVNWASQINNIPSIPLNGQTLAINDVTARYFRFRKEDQTDGAYFGLSEITFLGGGYETVPYYRQALPQSKYVLSGSTLNLSAIANAIVGETIASYQWSTSTSPLDGTFTDLTDGGDVSGTNTSNLIISNYTNGTPTYYRLTATQSNGCVVSTQVLVNLETTPYYPVSSETSKLELLNSWTVNEDGSVGSTPTAFAENKFFILKNDAAANYEIAADWENEGILKLNGNSLLLTQGYNVTLSQIEGFNSNAYVQTLGTGYLKQLVSNTPKTFPIGTSTTYSPVTITNNLGEDEIFSTKVLDGVSNPGTGITDYLAKTWTLRKSTNTTSGGTNLDITFEWDPSDVQGTLSEPMVYWSSSATTSSWSVLSSSYYASIEKGVNSITIKGFKGVLRNSDRYFIIKNAPPTITSFTPQNAGPGMNVVITGTGFTGATQVSLANTDAASFTVDSPTQITAVVGDGSGNGLVKVTTPAGDALLYRFYYKPAPTITSFSPNKTEVGNSIVIDGTNFSNVSEVKIGGVIASVYRVEFSKTQITAVVPDGAVSGSVVVTAEGGVASKDGFEIGRPLANAESIVSWYPTNLSTITEPYTESTRKEGAIASGALTTSGLIVVDKSDRLQFKLSSNVGSTVDKTTTPYISLKIKTESLVDFDKIVLQGLHSSYGTKVQLRWSVDDFDTSLGDFNGYTFSSTSSYWESITSSNWRYTSLSLAGADSFLGNEEIELRLYIYNNSNTWGAHVCIVKNRSNYNTNDATPAEFRDTDDAITITGSTKEDAGISVLPIEGILSDKVVAFKEPASNSTGAFTFSMPNGNDVAEYSDNQIQFLGLGETTLTVKQAETENYLPTSKEVSVTVKDYPVIELSNITAKVDDANIVLNSNSLSAGAISYVSSTPSVASVSGNTVSFASKGVTVITATQAASGYYLSAKANAVVLVKDDTKEVPSLSWINTQNKVLDDQNFLLPSPTSNSSGSFTYYSSNPQVATVSNNEVTLIGNGVTILTAVQEETSRFNAAKVITVLVVGDIYKSNANLSGISDYTKTLGDADFSITGVTSSNSSTIYYAIGDDNIASINGNTISLKSNGVTKIYAYQQESGTHKAAVIEAILTVNLPPLPEVDYSSSVELVINETITPLHPTSTGGVVSAYRIWPTLPPGLSINAQTGIISGTPNVLSDPTSYEVSATNLRGTVKETISISVIDTAPTDITYAGPQEYTNQQQIAALFPTVNGGEPTSFTISPQLPLGLSFNTTTGEISGTPIVNSESKLYTIKAINSGGEVSTTLAISVIDVAPLSLVYSSPNVLSKNVSMTPILPITTGGVIKTYTVIGTPLPDGLVLNSQTGEISGAPTGIFNLSEFVIRGENESGFLEATVKFLSNDSKPVFTYPETNSFTKGTAISLLNPTNKGGIPTSYSIAPSLPDGLTFNTITGQISGTPTMLSENKTYTVKGVNFIGTYTFNFQLKIVDVAPNNLVYPTDNIFTKGTSISDLSPTVSGGDVVNYSISPALPSGLSINSSTGIISGSPLELISSSNFTVTATNSGGSTTASLSITVNDVPPSSLTYTSTQVYKRGYEISPLEPSVSGGSVVSYSISPTLPSGLLINSSTGIISGTSQEISADEEYTITATNSGGSTFTKVNIAVIQPVLTVKVMNSQKIYGATDPTFDVTYTGFVLDEDKTDISGSIVFTRVPGEAVGNYNISASGLSSLNYDIQYQIGNLEITKAQLIVTANDLSKTFGEIDPDFTVSFSGFVNSDTSTSLTGTPVFSRQVGESAGTYKITASGYTSSDYNISFVQGTFTILPKVMSATDFVVTPINDVSYTGVEQKPIPIVKEGMSNLINDTDFTVSYTNNINVNTATVTITGKGNYSGTLSKNFNITPVPLTITANDKTKNFGAIDPLLTVSYDGFVNNESSANLLGVLNITRELGEALGSYRITPSGYSAVNYNISYVQGTLTITDNVPPVVITQNITVQLDANGNATITAQQIDNGSTDNSTIANRSLDKTSFNCANIGDNTVTLTVTDVNGNSATSTAVVTIKDTVIPTVITKDITVDLDANGNATITAAQIDNGSTDNCSIDTISISKTSFDCSNIGENTIILTVVDVHGNSATKTALVTVKDTKLPTVVTQDISVKLNANGNATITATEIDNGSSDNCAIATLTVTPNVFTTANIGENIVVLTVTDVNGNVSEKSAVVTVEDNLPPVVLTKNIQIELNASGKAAITASDIDNGSSDSSGIQTMSVTPSTFDCANVGDNTVTLTVTDIYGNSATSTAVVTIKDALIPTVITKDITVDLDANGNATVTAAQIDNGSTDNCSIDSISVNQTSFDCSNIGVNTVTLTVTDVHGNVATKTAIVEVTSNGVDTDNDGVKDNCDPDDDNDGTPDTDDAFPLDDKEDKDTDNDGIGDNSDSDIDGDGIDNDKDADVDGDGILDNGEDTDGDGVNDDNDQDIDGDGINNDKDADVDGDGILDNGEDTDGDGVNDDNDPDIDGDGINNDEDVDVNGDGILDNGTDNDGDGINDAGDTDDDNDGVLDSTDNCQFVYNPGQEDRDYDGKGDVCDTQEINISEAFTPNGDGKNDRWMIYNIENYPNNMVKVFNRWGQQIYAKKGYQNTWDGSHKGNGATSVVNAASYYYQIDLDGDGIVDYQGWIYITQ